MVSYSKPYVMQSERFIRPEEACRILQVTPGTLRSWSKDGKLEYAKTKGGHRRYNYSSVISLSEGEEKVPAERLRRKICYARVSSYTQKKDLETQIEFFKARYPTYESIKDLG